jgi:hypothetical protein
MKHAVQDGLLMYILVKARALIGYRPCMHEKCRAQPNLAHPSPFVSNGMAHGSIVIDSGDIEAGWSQNEPSPLVE